MNIEAQQVVTPLAAMKQALEALELTDNDAVYGLYRDEKRQVIEAITSLRQAIAEAEKHEVSQEPVVWMYQDKISHAVKFQKHMSDFVDHSRWYETPLYTTSPQRQHEPCPYVVSTKEGTHHCALSHREPLTDEQIAEIASTPCAVVGSYVHTFARAIEAAHNIFGEKK